MKTSANELIAPFFAVAGALLMLIFNREMEVRKMALALLSGPLFAGLLTPSLVAWLSTLYDWLPKGGHVEGALGCLIGMLSINMIAFVAHAGKRAERAAKDLNPPTLS